MTRRFWFLLVVLFLILTACKSPIESVSPTPTQLPIEVQLTNSSPERIEFSFNQSMKPDGPTPSLQISPAISGIEIWQENHTILAFEPAGGFEQGETYAIVVNPNLMGVGGLSVDASIVWELHFAQTQIQSDVSNPPRVLRRNPSSNTLSNRNPEIKITFGQEMDHGSVVAALECVPDFAFETHWDDNTLLIEPSEPLEAGVTYSFTLAKSASSSAGISMSKDYTWSYHIEPVLRRATWPRENNRQGPIELTFNYAMDAAQVESVIEITPSIDVEFSWDKSNSKLTFVPANLLPSDTEFSIHFQKPLLGMDGNEYPVPETIVFTTPSPILSYGPKSGKLTVNSASPIWVTFDRPMDPVTTEAAFSIAPHITGTLSWDENTLFFYPDQGYLVENTEFTVRLTGTAASAAGESVLRQAFEWKFFSGEYQNVASFGEYGTNAQVLDAAGRRAVQFVIASQLDVLLTFDLYQFSLAEFIGSYSSNFRGVRSWEPKSAIDTSQSELVKTWQAEFGHSGYGYGNAQEVIIPDDVSPGIYILNMGSQFVDDQLILILTHNTVAVKQAEDELVSWVSNINGESLGGIEVSIYARDGALIAQGRTEENGVYRTEVDRDTQPLLVVAREWDDYTVTGLSNEWRNTSGYWWNWWRPAPTAQDFSAYIYTDRPIYKPGQTVYFKAIVRHDEDAVLRLPATDTPVTARIRDARDNVVQTFELQTNYYGTANGEFQLAEGAMLGEYAVEVSLDGENHRQVFKVQDYRKPDLKISVETDAEGYLIGDQISVTIDTEYFFGEPVANADLVIRQYMLGSPYYWRAADATDEYIWYQSGRDEIRGTTDENGLYTFTLPAEVKRDYNDYYDYYHSWGSSLQQTRWGIEVSVDDGSNQQISGFAVARVFNAGEKISLDTHGYFKAPQVPFNLDIGVHDIFDQPVEGRTLTLELRRWNRDDREYSSVLQTVDLSTDSSGQAQATLTVTEPGYYRLYVQSTDAAGNPIEYRRGIYVFEEGSRWSRYSDSSSLSISADQERYAPGETAQLVIESAFSGPALLTFERGTTRHQQEVYLEAPMTVVQVPIRDDYAPNIFVTVNAWFEQDTTLNQETFTNQPDSRLQTASVELLVPVTNKTLTVTITPDKESYAPREEATFSLKITDQDGNPVRAELSLALVDEAIFSLSDDLSGPIFEAFYAERPHIVRTYNSMALYRMLWAPGMGGGGGEGDSGLLANPRSDFPDTALWLPTVRTNANGEAFVVVTLPDNLTTWRLTAKAVTADHKVGETVTNILTQQPIVVRPILPRTLTAGDQIFVSASVHNYSAETRSVDVFMLSDRLEIQDTLTQTVTLNPGEVRVLGWQATALNAGDAQITIKAVLPEGWGDAVQMTVPVHPLAIPDVNTWSGDFTTEIDLKLPWPEPDASTGSGAALDISTLKIELNRSIAGGLLTGLDYLTGFPYGCVEQTMSKALPNAVIGRAFYQLGVGDPKIQADLPPKINAGLQRLYGYQHNDGGWGWWFDDDTDAYQTAWVVFGLAVTAEAGYEVDAAVIERGADWLADNLSAMDAGTQAYALYSLAIAGHGVLTDTQALAADTASLDAFSQFALALTLHELGQVDQAEEIVDDLIETAIIQNGKAYWSGAGQDGRYDRKTMASDVRTTALGLSALVRIRPGHALEGSVVRWLVGQRTQTGWGTTNETSYAILGLTDHLLATELATASTEYLVELNGEEIASGTLGRGEPVVSLEIPASQMLAGENQLRITQSGGGRLYYIVSSHVYIEEAKIGAAGSVQVTRQYLDPQTNQPLDEIKPGDLVKVKLTVVLSEDGSYMLVEDKLPGGLEALNDKLNTNSHIGCANRENDYNNACEPRYYWREYGYNYKEVRSDRVSFFITEMPKGTYTFTYLARAIHMGTYTALPAEAWAMYDLSIWGRSASEQIAIR